MSPWLWRWSGPIGHCARVVYEQHRQAQPVQSASDFLSEGPISREIGKRQGDRGVRILILQSHALEQGVREPLLGLQGRTGALLLSCASRIAILCRGIAFDLDQQRRSRPLGVDVRPRFARCCVRTLDDLPSLFDEMCREPLDDIPLPEPVRREDSGQLRGPLRMCVGHWFSFASNREIADLALLVGAPLKMAALNQCPANLIDGLASCNLERLRNFVIVTASKPAHEIQHAFPMPHARRVGGGFGQFKRFRRCAELSRLLEQPWKSQLISFSPLIRII